MPRSAVRRARPSPQPDLPFVPMPAIPAAVCAMLVATTTYLSLSWGAYATFGVGVEGDLLEAYPRTGLLTAARVSVSVLVMSCYPLQVRSVGPSVEGGEGYWREPALPARSVSVVPISMYCCTTAWGVLHLSCFVVLRCLYSSRNLHLSICLKACWPGPFFVFSRVFFPGGAAFPSPS